MTIQDVARNEGISERQAQRYCRAPGYKGHVLKAVRIGRAFVIAAEDYKSWRIECGFDFLPHPGGSEPAPLTPADPAAVTPQILGGFPEPGPISPGPSYPPYPLPACPGGPITNVPHPSSGSMPHPQACADYFAEQARKMKAQMRGYEND